MADTIIITFAGSFDLRQLDIASEESTRLVDRLNEESDLISHELSERLGSALPRATIQSSISFRSGSLLWSGVIQITTTAWPIVEMMAAVGGALGLVQLVRQMISRVIARWLGRIGSLSPNLSTLHSTVMIASINSNPIPPPPPPPPSTSQPEAFISVKHALPWITLFNLALFIGGSIYTGVQVSSIEQRYEQANSRVRDAGEKYLQAEANLKGVQLAQENIKIRLDEISKNSEAAILELMSKSRKTSETVAELIDAAQRQYDLLKQRRAEISEAMEAYLKDSSTALGRTASDLAAKLTGQLEVKSLALETAAKKIAELGGKLALLESEVQSVTAKGAKTKEDADTQLEKLRGITEQLKVELERLAGTDKIGLSDIWRLSNVWLRLMLGVTVLAIVSALLMGIRRRRIR